MNVNLDYMYHIAKYNDSFAVNLSRRFMISTIPSISFHSYYILTCVCVSVTVELGIKLDIYSCHYSILFKFSFPNNMF